MPYGSLNSELFYPQGSENIATNEVVLEMVIKVADFTLTEPKGPKKAVHNYLSSSEDKFS